MATKKKSSMQQDVSIIHKNAQLMSVLYEIIESNREPTDEDAEKLKYLYSGA